MSAKTKLSVTGEFFEGEESTITFDSDNASYRFVCFLADLGILTQQSATSYVFNGYDAPQIAAAE